MMNLKFQREDSCKYTCGNWIVIYLREDMALPSRKWVVRKDGKTHAANFTTLKEAKSWLNTHLTGEKGKA